jgi:hypothetical protein
MGRMISVIEQALSETLTALWIVTALVIRTIREALIPSPPNRRQVVWAIRIALALAVATLSVRLLGVFDFVSNNAGLIRANVGLISALVALTGVLIAQVVNTYIAISARRNQLELEDRRTRAASLQSYLEQIGKLLIDHSMHNSKNADNSSLAAKGEEFSADAARVVAQAQTLAVLEGLGTEPTRKRILLQFLYESGLINKDKPIISLAKANLSGADLSGADLREADLSGAYLIGAELKGTDLMETDFREATNLTQKQVDQSNDGNETTKLPVGLHYPAHWTSVPE